MFVGGWWSPEVSTTPGGNFLIGYSKAQDASNAASVARCQQGAEVVSAGQGASAVVATIGRQSVSATLNDQDVEV